MLLITPAFPALTSHHVCHKVLAFFPNAPIKVKHFVKETNIAFHLRGISPPNLATVMLYLPT